IPAPRSPRRWGVRAGPCVGCWTRSAGTWKADSTRAPEISCTRRASGSNTSSRREPRGGLRGASPLLLASADSRCEVDMAPASQGPAVGSADATEALLDQAVGRLEEAWQCAPPPDLAPFLPAVAEPARRRLLIELIKVDQEYRWRRGDRRLLEAYLRDWPELR